MRRAPLTRKAARSELAQKIFDARNNFLVPVFKDVMPRVRNSQRLGVRETLLEFIKKIGGEAPVSLSPDEKHGAIAELRQGFLDLLERGVARMRLGESGMSSTNRRRRRGWPVVVRREDTPATAGVIRSGFATAIRSARRAKKFRPRMADAPSNGIRHTAIRSGIHVERKAAVLNRTNRENRSGMRGGRPFRSRRPNRVRRA